MRKIWILVHSHSGVIEEPEIYFDESSAMQKKKKLTKDFNLDYDDIQVFEKEIIQKLITS
ncbi:MAG: hypothetical protein HYY40_09180 [Bacteroidetes bacterium]|nr:hypothetical protein [Bacteroidota bacterium]